MSCVIYVEDTDFRPHCAVVAEIHIGGVSYDLEPSVFREPVFGHHFHDGFLQITGPVRNIYTAIVAKCHQGCKTPYHRPRGETLQIACGIQGHIDDVSLQRPFGYTWHLFVLYDLNDALDPVYGQLVARHQLFL